MKCGDVDITEREGYLYQFVVSNGGSMLQEQREVKGAGPYRFSASTKGLLHGFKQKVIDSEHDAKDKRVQVGIWVGKGEAWAAKTEQVDRIAKRVAKTTPERASTASVTDPVTVTVHA